MPPPRSKWDDFEDSDDDNDAIDAANQLNTRGGQLLHGDPEEAFSLFKDAHAKLRRKDGSLVSDVVRDLAGGIELNLAVAANRLKRWPDVVAHADAALALVPDLPTSGYDRSQALMWRAAGREKLGELREALADLRAAQKLYPDSAEVPQMIKRVERLMAAADYDAREAAAVRCNELLERADEAIKGERWREALVAATAALPLLRCGAGDEGSERKKAFILQRAGIASAKLGEAEAAKGHFDAALALVKEHKCVKKDGLDDSLEAWRASLEAPPVAPPEAKE